MAISKISTFSKVLSNIDLINSSGKSKYLYCIVDCKNGKYDLVLFLADFVDFDLSFYYSSWSEVPFLSSTSNDRPRCIRSRQSLSSLFNYLDGVLDVLTR